MSERPTTVVYCATSLDGYIARPDGGIDWLNEPDEPEDEDYGWGGFFADIDAIVMGRATFELVVGFGEWHYEDRPLTVLSTTMTEVPERFRDKATISALPPRELLEQLAGQGRTRVYVDGGKTVQSFLREDLIDELIVTRLPILIGQGIPLFGSLDGDLRWEHVTTTTLVRGLVKSHYRRARRPSTR